MEGGAPREDEGAATKTTDSPAGSSTTSRGGIETDKSTPAEIGSENSKSKGVFDQQHTQDDIPSDVSKPNDGDAVPVSPIPVGRGGGNQTLPETVLNNSLPKIKTHASEFNTNLTPNEEKVDTASDEDADDSEVESDSDEEKYERRRASIEAKQPQTQIATTKPQESRDTTSATIEESFASLPNSPFTSPPPGAPERDDAPKITCESQPLVKDGSLNHLMGNSSLLYPSDRELIRRLEAREREEELAKRQRAFQGKAPHALVPSPNTTALPRASMQLPLRQGAPLNKQMMPSGVMSPGGHQRGPHIPSPHHGAAQRPFSHPVLPGAPAIGRPQFAPPMQQAPGVGRGGNVMTRSVAPDRSQAGSVPSTGGAPHASPPQLNSRAGSPFVESWRGNDQWGGPQSPTRGNGDLMVLQPGAHRMGGGPLLFGGARPYGGPNPLPVGQNDFTRPISNPGATSTTPFFSNRDPAAQPPNKNCELAPLLAMLEQSHRRAHQVQQTMLLQQTQQDKGLPNQQLRGEAMGGHQQQRQGEPIDMMPILHQLGIATSPAGSQRQHWSDVDRNSKPTRPAQSERGGRGGRGRFFPHRNPYDVAQARTLAARETDSNGNYLGAIADAVRKIRDSTIDVDSAALRISIPLSTLRSVPGQPQPNMHPNPGFQPNHTSSSTAVGYSVGRTNSKSISAPEQGRNAQGSNLLALLHSGKADASTDKGARGKGNVITQKRGEGSSSWRGNGQRSGGKGGNVKTTTQGNVESIKVTHGRENVNVRGRGRKIG
eukprot:GHVN01057253.1.p1 GENE.GHVN01057253.1~~GHVN01057253.1.p1  ORF type:complete len:772 (-),score=100.80 GHVN01057253.1:1742-4057(-)